MAAIPQRPAINWEQRIGIPYPGYIPPDLKEMLNRKLSIQEKLSGAQAAYYNALADIQAAHKEEMLARASHLNALAKQIMGTMQPDSVYGQAFLKLLEGLFNVEQLPKTPQDLADIVTKSINENAAAPQAKSGGAEAIVPPDLPLSIEGSEIKEPEMGQAIPMLPLSIGPAFDEGGRRMEQKKTGWTPSNPYLYNQIRDRLIYSLGLPIPRTKQAYNSPIPSSSPTIDWWVLSNQDLY